MAKKIIKRKKSMLKIIFLSEPMKGLTGVPSKDFDQPEHLPNPIRVLTNSNGGKTVKLPSYKLGRLIRMYG